MERAADILKALLRGRPFREAGRIAAVISAWRAAVGEANARRTSVVDLQEQTLIVEVDHAARMQLLQMQQADILERMRGATGGLGVSSLRFRLSREAAREAPPGPRGSADHGCGTGMDVGSEAALLTEKIADEDLRNALRSLYGRLSRD